MSEQLDKVRDWIASQIIVDCGYESEYPCPHAHPTMGYEKCPHLDEDICMWQREQADEILSHPSICVLDKDQSLPDNVCENDDGKDFTNGYKISQQDMKADNWKKMIKEAVK